MTRLNISDFFNEDYVNYSSYDNLRKVASVVDGQKNASRKVLYTILEQNIKNDIKVSQLGSKVAEFCEYLHGNLDGVIVGLAQDFAGSNNIPLLVREGNFGTRFNNEASASRYIFTHGSKEFFELFNKDDTPILKHQTFEGAKIEPMFFVPSLPILLVNGSIGVSSGFAQLILPRNPKDIEKYIQVKLAGNGKLPKLIPWYKNFNGTIKQGSSSVQWEISGTIERVSTNRVKITELPLGYGLMDYIKVLDKLEDDKIIQGYKDLSEDNKFLFEVRIPSRDLKSYTDEKLLEVLKLVKKVSENFTVMSEDNKILVFDKVEEVIDHYIKVKLKYLDLRKKHMLNVLLDEISVEESRFNFITAIVEDKLIVNKRKKTEIEDDIDKRGDMIKVDGNYDYLLNMSIHSLTVERLARLEKLINSKLKDHKELKKTEINDIWLNEIKSLKI